MGRLCLKLSESGQNVVDYFRNHLTIGTRQGVISGILILSVGLSIALFSSWMDSSWNQLLGGVIFLLVVLAVWPMLMDVLRHRFDLFESRNVFAFFFVLYIVPFSMLVYFEKTPDGAPFISAATITQAALLSLLGLACFYGGYHIRLGEVIAKCLPRFAVESKRRLLCSTTFLFFGSLVLFGVFLNAFGGLKGYVQAGYLDRYRTEQDIGPLAVSMSLICISLPLLYYIVQQYNTRAWTTLFIVVLIGLSVLLFIVGRRRYLFTLIFTLLIYHHYVIRRFSVRQVALFGAIGFLLMSVGGVLRGIPIGDFLTAQTWIDIQQMPLSDLFYAITGTGEFSTTWLHFPEMMEKIANMELDYLFGLSYLQTPLIFVPRILYPNRPLVLSEWYVSTYYSDIATEGGGMGFFFLGEAYLNFGVAGIFLLMFVAGILYRTAYIYLKIHYDPRVVLIYAAFISRIPSALRVDFASISKEFVELTLLILLLIFFYSSHWRLLVHR